ncbi:phosphoribosyl-AMP cyclohydrolase, partial [Candidatus Bathyarchaeota archaeon]|nr:phosphoribosyl-AMP cyclohydrolase [Candidatus Bathyarchaeota archaeon]
MKINELDWVKMQGIIPVIAQEHSSKEVLTLAYVNPEALKKTIETGFAYYYRRSHREVMMKGVTSGNTQKIIEILTDCDFDSIIYLVEQKG